MNASLIRELMPPGDIKPGEYLTELFLDMAWDIDGITDSKSGLNAHLQQWMAREFGGHVASSLRQIMDEYYRLAYIRKPEFMGNTRTEERDPVTKVVKDLSWSEEAIRQRITDYERLVQKVEKIAGRISKDRRDAWFQLVEYPVLGSVAMNRKHLYAQLARHGKADWSQSDAAYDEIVSLTEHYNRLAGGKWDKMMDFRPRRLEVFDKVPRTVATQPLPMELKPNHLFNGNEFKRFVGARPKQHGLGYESAAISIPKGTAVNYDFRISTIDSLRIEVALAPNHPVEGNTIRYAISINDEEEQIVDYRTVGRSEEWKQNVLTNQTIRTTTVVVPKRQKKIKLSIKALDEGVIVDQVKVFELL